MAKMDATKREIQQKANASHLLQEIDGSIEREKKVPAFPFTYKLRALSLSFEVKEVYDTTSAFLRPDACFLFVVARVSQRAVCFRVGCVGLKLQNGCHVLCRFLTCFQSVDCCRCYAELKCFAFRHRKKATAVLRSRRHRACILCMCAPLSCGIFAEVRDRGSSPPINVLRAVGAYIAFFLHAHKRPMGGRGRANEISLPSPARRRKVRGSARTHPQRGVGAHKQGTTSKTKKNKYTHTLTPATTMYARCVRLTDSCDRHTPKTKPIPNREHPSNGSSQNPPGSLPAQQQPLV